MPTEGRSARLAVLIDADNTSAKIADGLFEEIAKIGEASVRRIYGDFSGTALEGLGRHTRQARHHPAAAVRLHDRQERIRHHAGHRRDGPAPQRRFDGFCLVSSDSDFTRLAARIREQGVDVFGFGEQKTPESFRQACRRFIYTENLLAEDRQHATRHASGAKSLEPVANAVTVLRTASSRTSRAKMAGSCLGTIGNQLANLAPDFDPAHLRLQEAERPRPQRAGVRGGRDVRQRASRVRLEAEGRARTKKASSARVGRLAAVPTQFPGVVTSCAVEGSPPTHRQLRSLIQTCIRLGPRLFQM